MLIPASLVGVIVFLYGCVTVDDDIPRSVEAKQNIQCMLKMQYTIVYVFIIKTELLSSRKSERFPKQNGYFILVWTNLTTKKNSARTFSFRTEDKMTIDKLIQFCLIWQTNSL